jgi:hypothetical protein
MRAAPADIVAEQLAIYLGPFTARSAVKTFALKALKKTPEELTTADIPQLLVALRPMLRTLVGGRKSEDILSSLEREFNL